MTEAFERDLIRGSLDLILLSVLVDGPLYGYLIQKRVREASGNRAKLPAGTLYPLLHRLESDKLIRSKWDQTTGRPRKWYELSAAGRRELRQRARLWQDYADCVSELLRPVLKDPPELAT